MSSESATEQPKKPEPTALALKKLAADYGVQSRMDALAMFEFSLGNGGRVDVLTIDLQKLLIRGFEIKVSRADFVGDDKWQTYLHYFNYFYFVAPEGLIRPKELPPEVWLLEWKAEQTSSWRGANWVERLSVAKRGKRLQPKFVRETYGEHFFHRILLDYIRNLQWRSQRLSLICGECGDRLCPRCQQSVLENPEANYRGVRP